MLARLVRCSSSGGAVMRRQQQQWGHDAAAAAQMRRLARHYSAAAADPAQPQVRLEHEASANDPNVIISTITLQRPKVNAMGRQFIDDLNAVLEELDELEDHDPRCVLLQSSNPMVFSAGADLKERASMSTDEAEEFVDLLRTTIQDVANLPMPTIAVLSGVALGGGLELALACDLRVACQSCTLGFPETSLAIIPGAGGTQRLPRLIGVAAAKELVFLGRRLNGQQAYDVGLVSAVTDTAEQAAAQARSWAWQMATHGPIAMREAKYAMDRGLEEASLHDALYIEEECYGRTLPTADRLEGLAAFKEGRAPQYKGR